MLAALGLPHDARAFIETARAEMTGALTALDRGMASGQQDITYKDLLYVRRRFITRDRHQPLGGPGTFLLQVCVSQKSKALRQVARHALT